MIIRPRLGMGLLTIGVAVVLGACSGSSPAVPAGGASQQPAGASQGAAASSAPVAGSGGSDSCASVVTKDAVSQATGFPIATTSGAAGICYFQAADVSKYLIVWVFNSQEAMGPMLQIESGSEHIADLGDDAFWAGAAGILFVRKGDHGVEFQDPDFVFTPDTNTGPRDALVTLARTALPNL